MTQLVGLTEAFQKRLIIIDFQAALTLIFKYSD